VFFSSCIGQHIPSGIRAVDSFQKRHIVSRGSSVSARALLLHKHQRHERKRRMFLNNECFFVMHRPRHPFPDQNRRQLSKKACRISRLKCERESSLAPQAPAPRAQATNVLRNECFFVMHRCQDIPSLIRAVDNFQKRHVGKRERESSLAPQAPAPRAQATNVLKNECFFVMHLSRHPFPDHSRRQLSKTAYRISRLKCEHESSLAPQAPAPRAQTTNVFEK